MREWFLKIGNDYACQKMPFLNPNEGAMMERSSGSDFPIFLIKNQKICKEQKPK